MTFWIVMLRIIGVLVFAWGVIGGTLHAYQLLSVVRSLDDIYTIGLTPITTLALSIMCFALASLCNKNNR